MRTAWTATAPLSICTRKVDMHLASHFWHAVDKAALYGIREKLVIRSVFIHWVDVKMHAHTVSSAFLYGRRNAHAKDVRIFL